jgi:hypothetical protein
VYETMFWQYFPAVSSSLIAATLILFVVFLLRSHDRRKLRNTFVGLGSVVACYLAGNSQAFGFAVDQPLLAGALLLTMWAIAFLAIKMISEPCSYLLLCAPVLGSIAFLFNITHEVAGLTLSGSWIA